MKRIFILVALSVGATIGVRILGAECTTIGLLVGVLCILIGKEGGEV